MAPWGRGEGRKNIFSFPNVLRKIFLFKHLAEFYQKSSGVNIDSNEYVAVLKQSFTSIGVDLKD
jgi:translation initiation factor 2 beta subunit (eIF-2beta)/eIF-5